MYYCFWCQLRSLKIFVTSKYDLVKGICNNRFIYNVRVTSKYRFNKIFVIVIKMMFHTVTLVMYYEPGDVILNYFYKQDEPDNRNML